MSISSAVAALRQQNQPQAAFSLNGQAKPYDWNAYLQNNPDVAQAYYNDPKVQSQYKTPENWAQTHYYQFGQNEGRSFGTPPPDPATTGAAAWQPPAMPQAPAWQSGVTDNMLAQSQAAQTQNDQRGSDLYAALSQRLNQSLNVSPTDPVIQGQVDAYRAEQQRASRDDLKSLAEQSGPYANLRGEQRMAAERAGQNTATFQSTLMQRELDSRRQEIQNALSTMGNLLSTDQQRELQRELGLLDQATQQQQTQLGYNSSLQDWQKALLANQSFIQQLGLQAEDRAAYYDAANRGVFRAQG